MVKVISRLFSVAFQMLFALLIVFGFHYDEIKEYNFIDFIIKFFDSFRQIVFTHLNNSNYGKYIAEFSLLWNLELIVFLFKRQIDILKNIATSLKKDDVFYEDDIEDL